MASKKKSGGQFNKDKGLKPIGIAVTPNEHKAIRLAAAECEMSMTQFVARAGIESARKLLKKISASPT